MGTEVDAPNPAFEKAPTEDTPVVHLHALPDEAVLDHNLTPDVDAGFEGLGAISSVGGYTDQELEHMEDFARSLAAKRRGEASSATTAPPPLPDLSAANRREQELRERLEKILSEGFDGAVAAEKGEEEKRTDKQQNPRRDERRQTQELSLEAGDSERDDPAAAIDEIAAELGRTLRGLPGEPEDARASEKRGSGFILLPTRDIRDAIGEGVYRLRVDGEEFGPVDATGVVALIKHGAVMAADEIAGPDGEWMSIMDHPAFERLRTMMAAEAHRVLRSLDITARRFETVERARKRAQSARQAACGATLQSPPPTPTQRAQPSGSAETTAARDAFAQQDRLTSSRRVDPVSVVVALLVGVSIGWTLAQFV